MDEQKQEKARLQASTHLSKSELISLMLKQNMESNRPAWDVRPVDLSKAREQ